VLLYGVTRVLGAFFGINFTSFQVAQPYGGGGGSYYDMAAPANIGRMGSGINTGTAQKMAPQAMMESADTIGFAAGGAKDINNFRENVANNFLPISTDITYEGLFYDYYFDTGQQQPCDQLFCPSYSSAITPDPLSGQTEYYLSVGLNSGLKQSDFVRKKLNLVVVLDISGSMGSAFNQYYYDGSGQRQYGENDEYTGLSKMQVANRAVVALLDHLNPDDRFGMVLFDDQAYIAKPLNLVGQTDIAAVKNHILEINDQGGTNMESGITAGAGLYEEFINVDPLEYENRIIFLTDAQPNTGVTSEYGLVGLAESNAEKSIFTTFIGVGVDFNTELIEAVTKIRGANYHSVHSGADFVDRMAAGFDYMVTPLVFDLQLLLESDDFAIEKVYGSPQADEATGEIMKVNTLFPSDNQGGEVKGGLVLLKLRKLPTNNFNLALSTSYQNRVGQPGGSTATVNLADSRSEFYQNSGIRKGILLTRYANLMKSWVQDERGSLKEHQPVIDPIVTYETGIVLPPEVNLGQWERTSSPLRVSPAYADIISHFLTYFKTEANLLNDPDLQQEVELLNSIISGKASSADLCSLPPQTGPCKAVIRKFYFDQSTQTCQTFNWGGCQGVVPFDTQQECQTACL
jgi:Ca-activated chloride channel family protein